MHIGYRNKYIVETDSIILIKWFSNNLLKINESKSHIIITSDEGNTNIQIGISIIKSSSEETLLGIMIDNKLSFNPHVEKLCKKMSHKLHTLIRIAPFMQLNCSKTVNHECIHKITIQLLPLGLDVAQ